MGGKFEACKEDSKCFEKRKSLHWLLKCEFGKTSLSYLGHIVGHGELKIDPSKVEVIVN